MPLWLPLPCPTCAANELNDVIAPSCYSCFDYPNATGGWQHKRALPMGCQAGVAKTHRGVCGGLATEQGACRKCCMTEVRLFQGCGPGALTSPVPVWAPNSSDMPCHSRSLRYSSSSALPFLAFVPSHRFPSQQPASAAPVFPSPHGFPFLAFYSQQSAPASTPSPQPTSWSATWACRTRTPT